MKLVAVALLVLLSLPASAQTPRAWPSALSPELRPPPHWIVFPGRMQNLLDPVASGGGGLGQGLFDAAINISSTWVALSSKTQSQAPVTNATRIAYFTSYAAFCAAVPACGGGDEMPPNVTHVLLDMELWAQTPPAEQADPLTYLQLAVTLAHSLGLQMICAPDTPLFGPGSAALTGNVYSQMVTMGCDVISSLNQRYGRSYSRRVNDTWKQIAVVNNSQKFGIGITTSLLTAQNDPDITKKYALATVIEQIRVSAPITHVIWLNNPANSPTNPVDPTIATNLLKVMWKQAEAPPVPGEGPEPPELE